MLAQIYKPPVLYGGYNNNNNNYYYIGYIRQDEFKNAAQHGFQADKAECLCHEGNGMPSKINYIA